ncbi:Membrane fusogenic activity protein [Piscirickettsia salmonis]|uniref:accessory factor UbiK family protein n=1 Tax=Piscirickettsia salmonis TaxID=1238 RepID=UPI0012BAE9EF|nr:accessory factor UbiK family protein [Piscirickettsia salmonis]QGP56489.1 Membrane fusogenic activity protein [Piscirickettsia salmonis]QGP61287.1 Membrane fusogenic activity protein [Piscirickettsia salmonis]QGP66053.1 Membrane fusogenic activity protein [Piscirickettsia salmonis]
MFDPKLFDDMAKKIAEAMPSGLKSVQEDLERNMKTVLQSSFQKMDLVTREEFDIQSAVLAKIRLMVEALERRVDELEAQLQTDQQQKELKNSE